MRILFVSFLLVFVLCGSLMAQDTNIPDPNFEQALIDQGIDSDGVIDGNVLTSDINTLTELNIFNSDISDLTGIEDFVALTSLNCSINRLLSIDLSNNTSLITLNVSSNLLTALDITANTALENVSVQDNLLTSLDVSTNTALINLDFTLNQIATIDLSSNDSLQSLKCGSNQLTDLIIANNGELVELICSSNLLTALDVSSNELLTTLVSSSNRLAALNVSQNDSLTFLDCSDNQLTALDVSNNLLLEQLTSSANQLTSIDVTQNDSLRSLNVANNQLSLIDITNNGLLENLIVASNGIRSINVETNTALQAIDISSNLIRSANLSNNSALTSVDCSNNLLEFLSVQNGNNATLSVFNALNNSQLACISIDDISQIGDLWLKDNTAIYATDCSPLTTAIPDPNFEQALIDLGIDSGMIDGLVITDSINMLNSLNVASRNISDLTGIEEFTMLQVLDCSGNLLSSLDFTKNPLLTDLNCSDNSLVSLNIKNGNNVILNTFDARTNPALTCIAVDDETQIGGDWQKDAAASYADNCNPGSTFVPDDNFENALIALGLDSGPLDNYVTTAAIDTVTNLDISGENIEELTGIEGFSALESLDCSSNLLFSLDISQNISLTSLTCFSNFLNQLDVQSNTALVSLNCGNNRLATLDVSQNTGLEELIVDSNQLTEVDVMSNGALLRLNCNSNLIIDIGLDLSNNPNLEELFCANNNLSSLDVGSNGQLEALDFSGNAISTIDLSQNTLLERLDCSSNNLANLTLTTNTLLDTLNADANLLQSLSFTTNPLLTFVSAENNLLSNIDLSNNGNLRALFVSSNELTSLGTANLTSLNILQCDDNQLMTLEVDANVDLLNLSCSNNQISELDIASNIDLINLSCDNNQLTELSVSTNAMLESLSFAGNQIDSINLLLNPSLTNLIADGNLLAILDLSNNLSLTNVSCSRNSIEELDLSAQSMLTSVNCSSNQLTVLKLANGNNSNLSVLNAIDNPGLLCIEIDDASIIGADWQKDGIASYSENCRFDETFVPDDDFESFLAQITGAPDDNDDYIPTNLIAFFNSLDASGQSIQDPTGIEDMPLLEFLDFSDNLIDSINLNPFSALRELDLSDNQLTEIDLTSNKNLAELSLSSNSLSELTLDSLEDLRILNVVSNQLQGVDLSNNTSLTSLQVSSNSLTSLNMRNGNNAILGTFDATNNLELFCIEVDDPNAIGAAWVKDEQASYSDDCHYNEIFVPDDAFEQALIDLGYDENATGPLDDYIPIARGLVITSLNISGYGVQDLTGLEELINLKSLNARDNEIRAISLDSLAQLEVLNVANNLIERVDLTSLDSLTSVDVSGNRLDSLDISQNQELSILRFSANSITGIDITQNPNLRIITGQVNQLFAVDANNGFNQNISTFNLSDNPNLTCILVDDIDSANSYTGWVKDEQAQYKLVCDDDDNDGVPDDEDICPATPFGSQVDLFGCDIFSLPATNFTILTTGESCRAGNNGLINIFAERILPYTATLTSELDSVSTYDFGDRVEIRNVRAGTYRLCITVAEKDNYEQCYTLTITEPEDLKVFSSGRSSNGRMSFEMTGGDEYMVDLNGEQFETTEGNITLRLKLGKNTIRIRTKINCQGTFEQTIFYSEKILPFPNPFTDELKVSLGNVEAEEVLVNIYSTSGKLQLSKMYDTSAGVIDNIDTSDLQGGVYILELISSSEKSTFKIMKR